MSPGIVNPPAVLPPAPSPDPDDDIFSGLFDLGVTEGAILLLWEQASRCPCITPDSKQPRQSCQQCGGVGVLYAPARQITGLFRARTNWLSFRPQGELHHGEAELTTPLSVKPAYVDRRVRDRITVPPATDDAASGTSWYPGSPPVPFLFNSIQRAWRVQLQSADRAQQLLP